jgi:hypothetical protein
MYILEGTRGKGEIVYYNGRAGAQFVGGNRSGAFVFASREWAERRAMCFNNYSQMHGVWFTVKAR